MSLSVRPLPVEEWHRLKGDLGQVKEQLPAGTTVIVVEREGEIVGQWSGMVLTHYHVEGLEILVGDHKTAIARNLLLGMLAHVRARGESAVLTGAQTEAVRTMLTSVGASKADFDMYAWPIGD